MQTFSETIKKVLEIGNFMMAGTYGGGASGFKMKTLLKLHDTKSNKNRFTLLHYLRDKLDEDVYDQWQEDATVYREVRDKLF